MKELDHPNIISLKAAYVEGDFVNLVMPHMVSDLRRVMEKRVRLTEAQVKCITLQICEGLNAMHSFYIMHRDLSPANVFINSKGVCKVADFGLSRCYGSPRPSRKTPKVVTLWYRAPELLYGAHFYQDKVDMWSLGCILGELMRGGQPLFPGTGEIDELARIFAVVGTPTEDQWKGAQLLPWYFEFSHAPPQDFRTVFPSASDSAIDLLQLLLTLDPMKRISSKDALNHEYFHTMPLPCLPEELPLHFLN
eukprot:GHVO01045725.1.p1 GENE.GHVO01045725.1~~GHVO01045725.1.p1  ORF type:complete len:250 (+),score=33.11 GHVO01045725.1:275-1024(+)